LSAWDTEEKVNIIIEIKTFENIEDSTLLIFSIVIKFLL
jgi:hypothetical protein